ncbi:hypothetical protein BaRGS_00024321 [Batillaria attramentaria]|uniref:Uncharacterized protein n=1 Tax=Batillaria attramentaria TaxID=370345 RepID=A0ABD0KBD3_9CAEN
MGCCQSQEKEDPAPLIVDVQKTIADSVWDMFYYSESRFRRPFLKRKDFTVEVPMNYYHFEETDQEFNVKRQPLSGAQQGTSGKGKSLLAGKQLTHRDKTSPEHMGLETDFKNSTSEKQTYNFKFEKTRKASLNVSYQRGFSFGNKTSFSVGLPKILADGKVGTEFDMHINVTKTTQETFEESLTTSATSDITVAPYSRYTASVVMEERMLLAEFKVCLISSEPRVNERDAIRRGSRVDEVWVMMVMPSKEARAFVKNKRGQNVFFYSVKDLTEFFPNQTLRDEQGKVLRQDAVQFLVEGVVDGMQLASHRINLIGHDISREEVRAIE